MPREENAVKYLLWVLGIYIPLSIAILGYVVKEVIMIQLDIARGEAVPKWLSNRVENMEAEIKVLKGKCQ